ncbi:MAG: lipoate--protein ligase family protein [Candidatus Cloacimonetes bacterium]|nr:lipoate--protein ligase family protein [Candidatus Cloacimonadota bacterium]
MAIDEAILNGVIAGTSPPTIRFYDWSPSTASIGYNQEVEKEIDFALLKKMGFGFVRRPTGGRLVLHDEEITYAVIVPTIEKFAGNVIDSYSEISRALAEGLRIMGVNVEFEKGNLSASHQRQNANPCFTSSSRYELTFERKKIVGSAQVRRENALLQHGSILLNHDQSKVAHLLPNLENKQREKLANFLAKKTISINQILDMKITFSDTVSCFIAGFKKKWNCDNFHISNKLTESEQIEVQKLIQIKYSQCKWNNRR